MSSNYQSLFGGGGNSDTERNYREGNWGQGSHNAEALASKFGLDRSQEGTGEGHIWGTRPDGSKVYIGKSNEGLKNNKELISAHSNQSNSREVNHSGVPESLSSSGDVKGAILNLWKGEGEAAAPTPTTVEEAPEEPIIASPHRAEALDRVQQWETSSWSGDRAQETFSPANVEAMNFNATTNTNTNNNNETYDARDEYTGPNTPESNAVLNAYRDDFANNFSPAESNLTNAFTQTALNQQGGDVPDMPSQAQSQEEDDFLKKARGQNLLNS